MPHLFFFFVMVLLAQLNGQPLRIFHLDSGDCIIGAESAASNKTVLELMSPVLGVVRFDRTRLVKVEPLQSTKVAEVNKNKMAANTEEKLSSKALAPLTPEKVDQQSIPTKWGRLKSYWERVTNLDAPKSWKGSLRVGLHLSQGDRQWAENNVRAKLEIQKPECADFYRIEGQYMYRQSEKNDGEIFKSHDRYNFKLTYRHDVYDHGFLQIVGDSRVDQIKGIDRDQKVLFGGGYQYKPSKKLKFLLGSSFGIRDYASNGTENFNGQSQVLNCFQELSWKPSKRLRFSQNLDYNVNPDIRSQYNYVLRAALSYRFTDLVGIELSVSENYDNDLGDGVSSKNDVLWRNSLVFFF